MIELSLQQALTRKYPAAPHLGCKLLLDEILLRQDAIFEFNPVTGALKEWAWYVLMCYCHLFMADS
jgi:hypothetical protein